MSRKKSGKNALQKGQKKATAVNTTIIEHLACLEINNLILQPPFHLISNIIWNDKGISFDGDIEVYSGHNIKKSNFISKVPVQVKGTTIQKTILLKDKIRHSIKKNDIEVYYKQGQGVLYFVVTINPVTYARQAYYKILAPLDLKSILSQLNASGKESITLDFKKLERGQLEKLCKTFINEVEKQPKFYIENSASGAEEFIEYKVNFIDVKKDSFDLFQETAYIYGITSNEIQMPLEATKVEELKIGTIETVILDGEAKEIRYRLTETVNTYRLVIEDTLTFNFDKKNKSCNFYLGRLRTLDSFIKCLQMLDYLNENNKLPLKFIDLEGKLNETEKFHGIKEEIESYKELKNICSQIGLSEHYIFNKEEDLYSIFNAIIDIFRDKKYDSLNINGAQLESEEPKVINVELSKYLKIKLLYVNKKFISFYSEEALTSIGGLVPKINITDENKERAKLPENWGDYYYKVSNFVPYKIEEIITDDNYDFEIIKLSYNDRFHNIQAELTINESLKYINFYDKCNDKKYLELALDLNKRYLENFPNSDVAKVNIYLIKLKQKHELSEEEQCNIIEIQERAESEGDKTLRFACEVLLKGKVKARNLLNALDDEERETLLEFPIYHFYETIK